MCVSVWHFWHAQLQEIEMQVETDKGVTSDSTVSDYISKVEQTAACTAFMMQVA